MSTAIVYVSVHHGNTKIIAREIAEKIEADLFTSEEWNACNADKYDIIGFGSGIYHGKHHAKLLEAAQDLKIQGRSVFIFSTSGTGDVKYHSDLKGSLQAHRTRLLGEFACKGYDTFGLFRWVGGIAKGRPNAQDIQKACEFANTIQKQIQEDEKDEK